MLFEYLELSKQIDEVSGEIQTYSEKVAALELEKRRLETDVNREQASFQRFACLL